METEQSQSRNVSDCETNDGFRKRLEDMSSQLALSDVGERSVRWDESMEI